MRRMLATRNVGTIDRWFRALPVVLVIAVWWAGALTGVWLILAAVVAAMLLMTSLTGSCSIYYMLGWSTCPPSGKPRP